MANLSKHAFGKKEDIESAKEAGKIDEFDIIFMDNGEIGWMDKDKNTVINTPRTQKAHKLNGVSLGALSDGDIVPENTSIDDLVEMITKKAIPATYVKPTLIISNNGGQASGYVEAGTSIAPRLRASFAQNDSGGLRHISILQGSNVVANGTSATLDYAGGEVVIGDETITFTASATYDDAPVKCNNLGAESKENWFAGDTIDSAPYNISGKRHLFYGAGVGELPTLTSDVVRGLGNKKLAPTQGYSFNIPVDIGQQYIIISYPATLRDISKITYVEANDGGMLDSFDKTTLEVADARGGANGMVTNKVYTYAMAVPAAAPMTFKVDI